MKGYAAAGETDPEAGRRKGKADGTRLDVKPHHHHGRRRRVHDRPEPRSADRGDGREPNHSAVSGSVQSGTFNLLVHDTDPRKKQMRYRIVTSDGTGQPVTFAGVKYIDNDEGLDAWQDTTTLYVKLFDGVVDAVHESAAHVRGAGIIQIQPLDFLQQMTTFGTEGPTLAARISALNRFGALFLGKLWDVYGRPAASATPA